MAQLRCLNPQCGEYQVSNEVKKVNPVGLRFLLDHPEMWIFVVLLPICWAIAVVIAVQNNSNGIVDPTWFIVWWCLGAAAWAALPIYAAARHIPLVAKKVRLHSYRCQTCGYQWTWREDQPTPQEPGAYNPSGLLRSGAEQLDRQNAAGANYEE